MMHFFRRSKLHIDCFTSRRDVIEYAPVVNAIEVIPDWWKALPKQVYVPHPEPTMKTCVGMYEYYNRSIAMPLWSEAFIDVKNRGYTWQFSDRLTTAEVHSAGQYTGFLNSDYGHIKIESPWLFSTKDDINWLLTSPIYNRTSLDTFTVAEGILNFSKQNATNIQMFIPVGKDAKFILPYRSTFLFTPLTDKKVVIHRHLVGKEEFEAKEHMSVSSTFINKYKAHEKVTRCPFHNHVESK